MSKEKKLYRDLLIALVLHLLVRFLLRPTNGLTQLGVNVLAAFPPIIYLWITEGTGWTSALALALLGTTGVMSMNTLVSRSVGSWIFLFCMLCSILNYALTECGFLSRVVQWFTTRKAVKGKPWVFLTFYFIACTLVSMFMSNGPCAVLLLTFSEAILKSLGYEKGEKFTVYFLNAVTWLIMVGYGSSPLMHPCVIIVLDLVQSTLGITVSLMQYFVIGIIFAVVMIALTLAFGKFIARPDLSKYDNYNFEERLAELKANPMSKREKATVLVYILFVIALFLPDIGSAINPELGATLTDWGYNVFAIIACVLLIVIHVDGKPLAEWKTACGSINMSSQMMIAAFMGLGAVVGAESTGINAFLQNILSPIASGINSWVLFVAFGGLITLVMTNFMSNIVSSQLVFMATVPLAVAMAQAGVAINPLAYGATLAIASCLGVATPAGTITAGVFFSSEYSDMGKASKQSILFLAFYMIVYIFIVYPVCNILLPY